MPFFSEFTLIILKITWNVFCGNSSKISINSRLPHLKAVLISPPFNPSWSDISLKLKFLPIKNPRTEDKSLYYAREMQIYSAGGVQNFHPFQVNEHQNHDFCLDFHTVYRFLSKLKVWSVGWIPRNFEIFISMPKMAIFEEKS